MLEGISAVYPRLWRFALTLTKKQDLADDLAQATVERAIEKAHTFKPGTHLDRWLFTIARRLWLNDIRRAERAQRDPDASELIDTIPDMALPTEVNILARQVFDQVMALPEKHRVVVLLVYVEGYTYLEASQLLEIPVGTVMSRLANARKALNGENVKTRKEGSR